MAITYSAPTITITGGTDTGTASSGASTTLTDSSKSWTTDAFAGRYVWIHTGTGAGALGYITSNTATQLTCALGFWKTDFSNFVLSSVTPDSTSQYVVSYSLQDIKDANDTGSWGVFSKQGTSQYYSTAKVKVGNGSTKSFLAHFENMLEFASSVAAYEIEITTAAKLAAGHHVKFNRGVLISFLRSGSSSTEANSYLNLTGGELDFFGDTVIRGVPSSEVVDSGLPITFTTGRVTIMGGEGQCVCFDRTGQIRNRTTNIVIDGIKKIGNAQFAQIANVPTMKRFEVTDAYDALSSSSSVSPATFTLTSPIFKRNTNADVWIYANHIFKLINPVWDRLVYVAGVSPNNVGSIYEQYSYDITVNNAAGSGIDGVRVFCKDNTDVQSFNALTVSGTLPQQILTYKKWVSTTGTAVLTTYTSHSFRFRKYGYQFFSETFVMSSSVLSSRTLSTNSFVVASDATASAYTGISINGSTKTITVSGTRTIQELYDYSQAWADDSGNIQYDEPITTVDGVTFTLTSGWSISVTGSLIDVTKKITGTITVSSGGVYEDSLGAKWDVSGTTYYGKHVYRNVKALTGGTNQQYAVVACFDENGNDRTYNTSRVVGGLTSDASGNIEGYYVWKTGSTTYTLTEYIGLYAYQWSVLPIASNGTAIGSSGTYDTVRLVTDPYVTLSRTAALALTGITANHTTSVIDGNAYTYSQIQDNLKARQTRTDDIEAGKKGYISYYQEGWLKSFDGSFYTLSAGWILEDTTFGGTLKDSILRLTTAGTYNLLLNSAQVNFEGAGTFDLRGSTITTDITLDTIGNYTVLAQFTPGTTITNNDPTNITVEASSAVTISVTNIVAGSRIQIYNTTDSVELFNEIVAGTSFTDNYTYTTDKAVRVRLMYVSGVNAYKWWTATGTITAAGLSISASQEVNSVYVTNNVDGSTVTECAINANAIDVQVDDPTNETTAQRIYNWYQYWLFSEDGIRDGNSLITATDSTHYVFDNTVQIKNMDTVNPLNILGANIVPTSGAATNVFDLSNGASIAINFNRVEGFAYSSGSGLSPAQDTLLSTIGNNTSDTLADLVIVNNNVQKASLLIPANEDL